MKKFIRNYGIFGLASILCAVAMSGCYVDSDNCREEPYYYDVCGNECYNVGYDWWGKPLTACDYVCRREVTWEKYCDYNHTGSRYGNNGGSGRYDSNAEVNDHNVCRSECCSNDDCNVDEYCENGSCKNARQNQSQNQSSSRGYVEMCGKCSKTEDCYEDGAKCTQLSVSNETVCTRSCSTDDDCPNGFRCYDVSDGNQTVGQCLPTNNSCDPDFCVTDSDCVENASCQSNRCVVELTNRKDCTRAQECFDSYGEEAPNCFVGSLYSYCTESCNNDLHCRKGYSCYYLNNQVTSGICIESASASCEVNADCADGVICRNGRCSVSCSTDADCAVGEHDDPMYCISGVCAM